jgi:hypothetical protein
MGKQAGVYVQFISPALMIVPTISLHGKYQGDSDPFRSSNEFGLLVKGTQARNKRCN